MSLISSVNFQPAAFQPKTRCPLHMKTVQPKIQKMLSEIKISDVETQFPSYQSVELLLLRSQMSNLYQKKAFQKLHHHLFFRGYRKLNGQKRLNLPILKLFKEKETPFPP